MTIFVLKNEIKIKLQTFCFGVDGKMEIAGTRCYLS